MDILMYIKLAAAAIGAGIGWALGGVDAFLFILTALVIIDYISGVLAAATEKKLSSAVGLKGIAKKVMIFLLVAVGTMADKVLMPDAAMIRDAVMFFYIANEAISITENATRLGLPLPKKLTKVLEQLKNKEEA